MVGKIPAEDIKCGGRGISAGTGADAVGSWRAPALERTSAYTAL